MIKQSEPVKLFWTGGWDSTFRFIQLLLIHKMVVQPYYIIDPERNSTLIEIKTMTDIKKALIEKNPDLNHFILPTIFKELRQIEKNEQIAESYKRLALVESIGIQYEWLARFCNAEGIKNIEISNETAIFDEDNRTRKLLGDDLDRFETERGVYYKLNERVKDSDKYKIYGNFIFPVFDYTKLDMIEISKKEGAFDVMKLTWFCHSPDRNNRPCGKCHPCRTVVREGLGWRLPFVAKLRYYTWPKLRKIANLMHLVPKN
ncbi:MAG: 7-cyano-7-deazaguanine synthase [Bacteroidetes bacterium]|nr:7-cyano-7-deazaguanine synthase [Bacteroidota bacterium]